MNDPKDQADSIISHSPEQTREIAQNLASNLEPNAVLTLTGELGAGKTHFVQGLAAGLGYMEEVTSPTFSLIQEYRGGKLPLFHIDFYRLQEAAEADALGLEEEYFEAGGVTAIEWAEKFPDIRPEVVWRVKILIRDLRTREIQVVPPEEEEGSTP
jgi:tRNA threonylcarbamoyladenosine biosynthesis protein TsaE